MDVSFIGAGLIAALEALAFTEPPVMVTVVVAASPANPAPIPNPFPLLLAVTLPP